jgi:hypothetical protein
MATFNPAREAAQAGGDRRRRMAMTCAASERASVSKSAWGTGPGIDTWTRWPNLADSRYYPTCITIPDGRSFRRSHRLPRDRPRAGGEGIGSIHEERADPDRRLPRRWRRACAVGIQPHRVGKHFWLSTDAGRRARGQQGDQGHGVAEPGLQRPDRRCARTARRGALRAVSEKARSAWGRWIAPEAHG